MMDFREWGENMVDFSNFTTAGATTVLTPKEKRTVIGLHVHPHPHMYPLALECTDGCQGASGFIVGFSPEKWRGKG